MDDRTSQLENLYAAPEGGPSSGLLSGTLTAIPRGIGDASAQLDLQAKQVGLNLTEQAANVLPESYTQALTGMSKGDVIHATQQAEVDNRQRMTDIGNYIRPNPQTTGVVGQTLYGLSDLIPRATVGSIGGPLGAATAVGLSTGYEGYADARANGVDPHTAAALGGITGVANAIGLAAGPTAGIEGSALKQFLAGAAFNTALTEGGQQLSSVVLLRNGYNAMADQYAQVDASSLIANAVLGGYFGYRHGPAEISPQLMDAAARAQDDVHYQGESAPGVPADFVSMNAHADAMDQAREQLLSDQDVQVADRMGDAKFIPNPNEANAAQSREALAEAGYTRAKTDEEIESLFNAQLEDHEQAAHQYSDIPETEGGKVINTDIARELSPDYLADRTRSAAVHEPASAFTKRIYADLLAQEPQPWEEPQVLFTAGGTGAGKSTGIGAIPEMQQEKARSQIVYDTNMNKLSSADQKIQQALAAGKKVKIAYTYRDPVEALVNGALPRAERQRTEFGTGRTVPLAEHLKTHVGALETMRALAEKYKDNPDVEMKVIDNSRGKGNIRLTNLDSIPDIDENTVKENLTKALENERQAGRISEETYRGFAGEGERLGAEDRGQPQPERPGGAREGSAEAASRGEGEQNRGAVAEGANARNTEAGQGTPASPEEVIARQIAAEQPDSPVTYRDENGQEVTESASQALSRLDEEQGTMQRMADAVRAAVTCALRFGE